MRPTGKVNFIFLVIVAVVVYGGWWGVTYGPSRLDNLDVKEHVIAAFNQAKTDNYPNVMHTLLTKLNHPRLGWHREVDEAGNSIVVKGLGIKEDQVRIEMNDVTNMITITVDYDREVELKPFDKIEFKHFTAMQTGPWH